MPRFTVIALEKFLVRTTYTEIEAASPEQAVELVKSGEVAYDDHSIEEGDEEFIKTLEIEQEG